MAWDPTHPATSGAVVSAPLRDNFGALDALLVAPVTALANGQVLYKAAGPVIAGVPAGTNGYVLTLVGGVPLWQTAPQYPLLAPDGTGAAPSYSFVSGPDNGLYYHAPNMWGLVAGGTLTALVLQTMFSVSMLDVGLNGDVVLVRDAAGVLAQRNGANLQIFRIHEDATNYLAVTGRTIDFRALASAPATPAAGRVITYAKTDKKVYAKDDGGVETPLGGLQNPMVGLGDLIVGGASGTPGRLGVGTTGQVLTVASGTPTWAAPTGGAVSVVPLALESARFPDGTANNAFPQPVERISAGTPPTNYPKLVELVYQFDAGPAVIEHLIWKTSVPGGYAGGAITVVLKWSMLTATTGNIRAMVGLTSVADATSGLAPVVTATATSVDIAVPATAGVQKETRLVPTGGTSPAAGHKLLVTASLLFATTASAAGDRVLEAAWLEFAL